jgi:hypothetical protein
MNRKPDNSREIFVYEDTGDTGPVAMAMDMQEPEGIGNEIDLIEDLAERLTASIAGKGAASKQEVEEYIGLLFKDYPSLKASALRESISELVVSECEKNGIGSLSKRDVDKLW